MRSTLAFAAAVVLGSVEDPGSAAGTSEGNVALIDTGRPARAVDLTETVARLPGTGGDGGRFDVSWA